MDSKGEIRAYHEEKIISNIKIIPQDKSEIITNKQLKYYICKIYINNKIGTGFFCYLPFFGSKLLPVLITNNHILKEEDISLNKQIEFSFDNGKIKRELIITQERRTYTNYDMDITIIEIFPEKDRLIYFLNIIQDKTVYKRYQKLYFYILQYPDKIECSVAYGNINNINGFEILHKISTKEGSSGGPILLLEDPINKSNELKVLGIHKGSNYYSEENCGSLLDIAIEKFKEKYSNEIRIKIKIEENDINKDIYIINYPYLKNEDGIKYKIEELKEINALNFES